MSDDQKGLYRSVSPELKKLDLKFVFDRKNEETGEALTFSDEVSCTEYPLKQFISLFDEGQNTKNNVVARGHQLAEMLNSNCLGFRYAPKFEFVKDLSPCNRKPVIDYMLEKDVIFLIRSLYLDIEEVIESDETLEKYFGSKIPHDIGELLRNDKSYA